MSDHPSDSPVELAGFDIQRRLGAGGMAEVFLAHKRGAEGTFKQLVVKRILPEHASSRRFRHMFVEEAHLATRLNHPNIVQVYEFSDHGEEGLLLSMEYVEGIDLGKLIRAARKRKHGLPPWVSAFTMAEVAKGLHYAHERKDEGGLPLAIVHRDVSPQNVLISVEGVVKIADFGIASANLFREETGVLKGKFGYMSPEQARGEKVDRRSDVYAMGVVLYEMLTGRSPYGALKDGALAEAVRHGAAAPIASVAEDLPEPLIAIVDQAMAKRRDDRFSTAREMSGAIARALMDAKQLIDHIELEELITEYLGKDGEVELGPELQQRTLAAVRRPRTSAEGRSTHGSASAFGSQRIVREVRHVAVLQLRLSGFDELSRARGELPAKRALNVTRATLDDIAYKRGAVWSWEDSESAQAVVGLMANPSRAPSDSGLLATDVHEFLAGHSQDLGADLGASVAIVRGIAAGERDQHGHLVHHDLHPPAAYLVDQLVRRTPVGETWAAGGVYRLVRQEFRWADGPAVPLADAVEHAVPERMRVYQLVRPLSAEERAAETALNPTDLVGRDAEKADLHAAYHRALHQSGMSTLPPPSDGEGKRRRVSKGELVARVLIGEMGIGKTALIDAFLAELPQGCRIFRVDCSPVTSELPYATVASLLRVVTGVGVDEPYDVAVDALMQLFRSRSDRPNRYVRAMAELIVDQAINLADEDALEARHGTIVDGIRYLFAALAAGDTALVLAIDSMQWADLASLRLLKEVLEKRETLAVLTILGMRQDERLNPFVEGLMRIELKPLSPGEQVRLVQTRLGVREGVQQVCRDLVPRVGGNPFFLLEMIDALLERGVLEIDEPDDDESEGVLRRAQGRGGEEADALPSTIEQLIGDRLRELPPAEHDVVDWLAVAGGPLSEADLMALTRLTDDEPITRLCARGLCDRRVRAIDFRHPLARDVAYNALEVVQRARMHRRLGEHYADTHLAHGVSAAIVAQHLERGEAPKQAAELYLEAAGAARSAHQTLLCRRYFERTLDLLPIGDNRRMVAHEALERIHRHLGEQEARRKHLEALRKLAHASRQARWLAVALARTAELHLDEGVMEKGLPYAERAAELARFAKQPDIEVDALIARSELLRDLGDELAALEVCDQALEVASSDRVTPRARAQVLRSKGVLLRRAGRLKEAVEAHAKAIAIFKTTGARRAEARARNALAFALFVLGRYEDTIAMCLTSLNIDVMIGGRFQVAKTLANAGVAYSRLGDRQHAEAYLEKAREAHQRYGDHDGHVDTLLVSANHFIEVGSLDQARACLKHARSLAILGNNVYDNIHLSITEALCARGEGQHRRAADFASAARALATSQALVSYQLYATSIEAASRVAAGEDGAGVELAIAAFSLVESLEGSEYGIEARALCCFAVREAKPQAVPPGASALIQKAIMHVEKIAGYVRDRELKALFLERPPVVMIMAPAAPPPGSDMIDSNTMNVVPTEKPPRSADPDPA